MNPLALRVGPRALTHNELAHAIDQHRALLSRAHIAPGAHVAVWTHPTIETLIALAGNLAAGVVSVPLNPASGPREIEHVLADAAPTLILIPPLDASEHASVLTRSSTRPTLSLRDAYTPHNTPLELPTLADDDSPALVLYTSGTTGKPKGAVLTRRNIATNLDALADAWGWTSRDTLVHALPVFHVHGLVLGLFGSLRHQSALHWLPRFDPLAIGQAFTDGATLLFAVPTMYNRIADALEAPGGHTLRDALSRARVLVSGSAPLALREHTRLSRALNRHVIERYGLTETLINCALRHDAPPRPGTVGPALAGVELRLVDDSRAPLTEGLGEIAVRGPNVFAGYLHGDEATHAARDAHGWFYTGDIATIEPDGAVRIVGRRATDLIKTGGFKVGAGEVEASLLEHPAVAEAAVLGVPDADLGERIIAFVVPRDATAPSPAALIDHVASLLAPHKRPREVRFVAQLPRNAMGKVLKPTLRATIVTP